MSKGGACHQNIEELHKENAKKTVQTFEEKRLMKAKWFATLLIVIMLVMAVVPVAGASRAAPPTDRAPKNDNLPSPLGQLQAELRQKALEEKLNGKTKGKTHEVARGQFVELERTGEDSIWTVLGEFKDIKHNQIPAPDRSVDNTTIWAPDFSQAYFKNLLFSEAPGAVSMRNFYIELSSNRYAVNGDVTNWVSVPNRAISYDDDKGGPAVWGFVNDSVDSWFANSGMSAAQIDAYLSQFDVWDRYDYDGDGNFNEPDGYIDHFQSVHAGMGEEVGGGVLGANAIWSHRWYAFYGADGPDGTGPHNFGGVRIGNSNYWIGDYTIEPENGGVGVFSHEFGHDLGLPDLYDTAGGENSTGFWTLMSSGSYGNSGIPADGIGTKPIHMGAWEKFQLGWLNYQVGRAGETTAFRLGPVETNTKQAQGVFVILPKKTVVTQLATPIEGSKFFYSGAGDNLDNLMYKSFNLPSGASLSAKVNFDIELDWDYAYLVASTDNGATWTNVATNLSTNTSPNGQNFGNGITGSTGGNWVDLTANLSGFTGNVLLGFRYWTDGAVAPIGFMVDAINITGSPLEGAETETGWTFKGFKTSTGTESKLYSHYYVAEFRQYRGYDQSLQTGPYNFGFLNDPARQNWVEHFPYQDGLLISYWDTSQRNNNTSQHNGQGLILPIDAHPKALIRPDGKVWRGRMQTYDATFGLEATDGFTLHLNGVPSVFQSLPAAPLFNDLTDFWDPASPLVNVKTPDTGTTIQVQSYNAQDNFLQIVVGTAK
jgi:immune inhibitor A